MNKIIQNKSKLVVKYHPAKGQKDEYFSLAIDEVKVELNRDAYECFMDNFLLVTNHDVQMTIIMRANESTLLSILKNGYPIKFTIGSGTQVQIPKQLATQIAIHLTNIARGEITGFKLHGVFFDIYTV